MHMQAATCGRCRSEMGEAGRVCRHCRMDDVWVGWETRLFRLETRAMGAGGYVSHEDALRQVSLASVARLPLVKYPRSLSSNHNRAQLMLHIGVSCCISG